jgi:hypothetical protein
LIDLLDPAGELVCRLRPVVILHRDHEDGSDVGGLDRGAAHDQRSREREPGQDQTTLALYHENLRMKDDRRLS